MRLKVFVNEEFEDERALVRVEDCEVLVIGDVYHNKIDEMIEGFLLGLDFANIPYTMEDAQWIDSRNPLYSIIGFSDY